MHALGRDQLRQTFFGAALLVSAIYAGGAWGQVAIGGAKVVVKDVTGQTVREASPLHIGDQVFQDESVRTAAESLAQLALLDETSVSIGPSSQLKLDRFVYEGSGTTAKNVVLNASRGAFRFFSGNSPHSAYQVTTPEATIGVRGTIYDVELLPGLTRVVLRDGRIRVCVRNTRRCRDLTRVGTSVDVTSRGIQGPIRAAATTWTFDTVCRQYALPSCERTTLAGLDLSSPGLPPRPPTGLAGNVPIPPPPGPPILPLAGGAVLLGGAGAAIIGTSIGHVSTTEPHPVSP